MNPQVKQRLKYMAVKTNSKSESTWQTVGAYAFIVGVGLSIIMGVLIPPAAWMVAVLAILGLAVALINIKDEEVSGYLLANIAVLIGSNAFNTMLTTLTIPLKLGAAAVTLQTITGNLVFFVAPGAVLIALRQIYKIAKEQ